MSPEERQALREKHHRRWDNKTPRGEYQCFECGRAKWPCDAIRLLDEIEMWIKE